MACSGHPVFQPEEGRQEVSSHFVPRFDREYCTPEPAMQGCNKRLQRGSLECLPRANRDYTRQLNHAKNEPQQVDHNHNTKVSQNRGTVFSTDIALMHNNRIVLTLNRVVS